MPQTELPPFATDESRWAAVAARDGSANGHFFFAVRTTGVYCRPSCAARLPLRKNVSFYASPDEARQAGFRACKRCHPDRLAQEQTDHLAVTAAARMMDAAIADARPAPSLEILSKKAGYSPFHFHRMFKKILGVTPKAYEAALRARRMSQALRQDNDVTQALHEAGYSSSSRFYETATARLGMAPKTYRAGGTGETIHHAFGLSSLGLVLVGGTQKGICAILFGASEAELLANMHKRFPHAALVAADASFASHVEAVLALIEQPEKGHDLPLDVRGTAFQERVWQALRSIPAGQTANYTEVAQAIGKPKAARAVALACGANPTAVAIPCHRVVRTSGELSGYRWGLERKAALLKREGAR